MIPRNPRQRRHDTRFGVGKGETTAQDDATQVKCHQHRDPAAADRVAQVMLAETDSAERDQCDEEAVGDGMARPDEVERQH